MAYHPFQPQGHVQVLLSMLRGFTPQAALDAPRFCISAGTPDSEVKAKTEEDALKAQESAGDINSKVYFEEGIAPATVMKLRGGFPLRLGKTYSRVCTADMGHDAHLLTGLERGLFGRGQVIQKLTDQSGKLVWAAGSDLRADGHAVAQI
jgi:gamma-glutamyltranspeptidase/glutathione hydrolase